MHTARAAANGRKTFSDLNFFTERCTEPSDPTFCFIFYLTRGSDDNQNFFHILKVYLTRGETVIAVCSLKHRPLPSLKTHKQHYYLNEACSSTPRVCVPM